MGRDVPPATPSLETVRARIDAVDGELLRLLDERASLAASVAAAKRAAGETGFGLRPGREAQVLRRLLAQPREAAEISLIVRIWREVMGDNLTRQGPFHITVWGGRSEARVVEFARFRFGATPALAEAATAQEALAAAKTPGGVAALALEGGWWGRLLAEPRLKVFSTLPCLAQWGPLAALAVAEVEVEPTGADVTFWVTDATGDVVGALSRDGVAATLIADSGGLKLFSLAGYYQPDDERLARAPGRLSGVIGSAPEPFDV